jgi:hypothetical protein
MDEMTILPSEKASLESFHDCQVKGIAWDRGRFSFEIALDYIVKWVAPAKPEEGYGFMLSPARLVFQNVDDVVLSLDWTGAGLMTQIAQVSVTETRSTPTGVLQHRYLVEFSEPSGEIELWSTGYEVRLLGKPEFSRVPVLETS